MMQNIQQDMLITHTHSSLMTSRRDIEAICDNATKSKIDMLQLYTF